MKDRSDVVDYFRDYAAAFDAFDAEAIAAFYHVPCLLVRAGSDAVSLASSEAVLGNMRALVAAYRSRGYDHATFDGLHAVFLDRALALVTVPWTLHLRDARDPERFRNTYYLAELAGRWRILVSSLHASGSVGS